ncbi:MAG: hypothetical protein LUH10_05210 [Tannerellaceae bacterium]|nr:hypothetical protein [Tannerellaceae bacterium]
MATNINKIAENALDEMRKIYKRYQDGMQKITNAYSKEWKVIGGIQFRLSDEAVSKNIEIGQEINGQLKQEYTEAIQKIIDDTEETLATAKKKAIQDKTAAEPVPTEEDLRRVEQLRNRYSHSGVLNQMDFNIDIAFHVENETVQAYAYYLLGKEQSRGDEETEQKLNEVYNKLFPEIAVKDAIVKEVEEAIRQFRIGVILFTFGTDETLNTPEGNFRSISLKVQLNDLGYYQSSVVEHAK